MHSKEYLYGDAEVEPIPEELIVRRVEVLKEHLSELMVVPMMERDTKRYTAVLSAIDFWEKLNEQ